MAKKKITGNDYWEKRRELENQARLKMEDATIKSLTDIFPEALKKIQDKLLSQADMHAMTQNELLQDVPKRDQEKYRKYVNDNYEELMNSDEKYHEFIDEYFPPYDYAKANRLLQMRSDIFSIMASEMIKKDANEKFNKGLEDIINRTYASNSNALMHILGTGEVTPISKADLENMLNYPWSGKTFSSRLWGNVSRLEQNLSNAIVNAVVSGEGVIDALTTMRNDPKISDMFKLEEDKFDRAITNLVRTEYAHFAVEGAKKSMHDAGIENMQSWSAEDERVCDVCGDGPNGRHGKIIKDGWYPPYHGRCRCSVIPKMPELGEDIDLLYEEMFGDLLDEFANDQFGIKLTHPKMSRKAEAKSKTTYNSSLDKTNMKKMVGKENYENFIEHLNGIENERVKQLINSLGDQLEFAPVKKNGQSFAKRNLIHLKEADFSGYDAKNYMEVVYHEIGHALDYLGLEKLKGVDKFQVGTKKVKILRKTSEIADYVFHASGLPDYNLKEIFERDLWEHINGDLPMFADLGPKPRKKALKQEWEDERSRVYRTNLSNSGKFTTEYKEKYSANKKAYSALSDMTDSMDFVSNFGGFHGKDYWKKTGMAETEFFAHMTEMAANKESEKVMREMFPEATKVWEKMVDDILEKVK